MFFTGSISYLLLITGALGILLLAGLLLKRRPPSYYFFSGNLLIVSYSALLLAALKSGGLLKLPHLFLTGSPLQYLIGPGCFYFALLSINPYHKFRKKELLHLVPFILNLLELTPFFVLGAEEKLSIITASYQLNESVMVLPKQVFILTFFEHLSLKSISMVVYSLTGFMVVWRQYRSSMISYKESNLLIFKWVTVEIVLKFALGIVCMLKSIWNFGYQGVDLSLSVIIALDTIIGFGFILLNPRILHGTNPFKSEFPPLFGEPTKDPQAEISEVEPLVVTQETVAPDPFSRQFRFIESYFQTQKPFLKEDFSRETLVTQTGLNRKIISEAIKTATGMNFSDYVNSYRIRYLEENAARHPEWKKYTVDALGNEIGFFNRGSFYNAVKRHRNITAGQFLKQLGLGERE